MKKGLIIGGLFMMTSAMVSAQQLGQFSQYVQNQMLLNPAATGIFDYTDINLSMRRQWTGIDNAPSTMYASVNARLGGGGKTPNYGPMLRISTGKPMSVEPRATRGVYHGLGGYLMNDEYGAFRNLSGKLSYALHLPLGEKFHVSLGAGLGVSNLAFDQTKVQLTESADNTYNNFIANGTSGTFFDANAGVYLYSEKFFLGYSTNQLFGDQISFGDKLGSADLQIHHFATLGYTIAAGENLTFTPSAMFKLMSPTPGTIDVNLKAEYRERFWAGVSYRHNDAIVPMIGFNINNTYKFGYSYDLTTSNLGNYNNGSHEVLLGIMLGRNKS